MLTLESGEVRVVNAPDGPILICTIRVKQTTVSIKTRIAFTYSFSIHPKTYGSGLFTINTKVLTRKLCRQVAIRSIKS